MATARELPGKSEGKGAEQLNCPICLEMYKSPRVLNCLHCFCETCINSYIIKAVEKGSLKSAIPCPLCRTDILAPSANLPPTEWAKDFPENSTIVNMFGSMESESRIDCDNCKGFDRNSPAESYCRDCKQNQCKDCVKGHSVLLSVKGHQIVKLTELPKQDQEQLDLGRIQYCQQHIDREVAVFCQGHKALCCYQCQFLHHRACDEVTEVRKLGHRLKEGDQPQKLDAELETLQSKLDEIAELLEINVSDIEKQSQSIPQQMTETRNKLVRMFDQLVNTVTSDCGQFKKQQITEIEESITRIRSLQAAVYSSRNFVHGLLKNGSESQIFIAMCKLEEQVSQYYNQVIEAQGTINTVELRLVFDAGLEKIVQSTSKLAKVAVQKKKLKVNPPVETTPIVDCVMKKMALKDIQKRKHLDWSAYCGAELLTDGRLVTIDYRNHLCSLLDDSFNVVADVKLPAQPLDLAVIGPTEVIIVLGSGKQLQHISIGTQLTLTKTFSCSWTPTCISRSSDTELIVGWKTGMGIIRFDGREGVNINRDKSGREIRFSVSDRILAGQLDGHSRFYHSCWNEHRVDCLGITGEVHFRYSHDLEYPCGMSLDRDRNLYVCSYGTRCVHQVSPAGQLIQIIATGLDNPFTVCFNPAGDQMTVMGIPSQKGLRVIFVPPRVVSYSKQKRV